MSAQFALPAAVSFGVADFAGGMAAQRSSALRVTAIAQLTGGLMLVPALLVLPGTPSLPAAATGALAGLSGALGLVLYFRALAIGPMGVVAPLSALTSAGLPLAVGIAAGERPGAAAAGALGLGLLAIGLATAGSRGGPAALSGLLLGIASGAGFGLFFVVLDATPDDSGLWPLATARIASVALIGGIALARTGAMGAGALRLTVLSGALDMAGNVLFLLATRAGPLAINAVLVSLYPIVVVVLARFVLRERLRPVQLLGVALAMVSCTALSTAG